MNVGWYIALVVVYLAGIITGVLANKNDGE